MNFTATATRTATAIEISINGEVVTSVTGKASIARPFVALGFGSVWTGEGATGLQDMWKATSHRTAELAAKAKNGDAHYDSHHFTVVEVQR